jgi:hypothetical protein
MYPINTLLQTKDGRIIGNAIIAEHQEEFNIIKTDYGNPVMLNDKEVNKLFFIGVISDDSHKHFNHDFPTPKVKCSHCGKMHKNDYDCLPF